MPTSSRTARDWYELGEKYRQRGRSKEALKHYLSARRLWLPEDLEQRILHASALCYAELGNYPSASVWFARAVPSVRFGKDLPEGPPYHRPLTLDEVIQVHRITRDWAWTLAKWRPEEQAVFWTPDPYELLKQGRDFFAQQGLYWDTLANIRMRRRITQLLHGH